MKKIVVERKNYRDQYTRKELLQLVIKYRYPKGVNGKKRNYYETYEEMKKDKVLPITWSSPSSLHKFMRRAIIVGHLEVDWDSKENIIKILSGEGFCNESETVKQTMPDSGIHEHIISVISNFQFTIKDMFNVYWSKLSNVQKTEFMEKITEFYLKKGIAMDEISLTITKEFEKMNFLNSSTIRKFIDEKYKNSKYRELKIGKTFSMTGKESKKMIEFKKFGGEKLIELEKKQTELEIENIKIHKEILELKGQKPKSAI